MPDLSGAWAKLDRAGEHNEAIDRTLEAFVDEFDPYHVSHALEADGWYRFRWRVRPDVEPPLTRFSLFYGELLYNLHASLDYVVWQLVLAADGTPTHEHAFPCVMNEQHWASAVSRRLNGIDEAWIHAIRDLQPFSGAKQGTDPRLHWFAILDYLNNVNKHRLLSAAVWSLHEFRHDIEFLREMGGANIEFDTPYGPVADGAMLYGFKMRGSPDVDYKVKVSEAPTVQVTFSDGLAYSWKRADLIAWVHDAIAVFASAFAR